MPNTKNTIGPVAQPEPRPARTRDAGRPQPLTGVAPSALDPVAAAAASTASKAGSEKPANLKAPKLVRRSFTISKAEYKALEALKERAGALGGRARKSDLLRAGIQTLSSLSDEALLASLAGVPSRKAKTAAKH